MLRLAVRSRRSQSCPAKPASFLWATPLHICSRTGMLVTLLCREFEAGQELTALVSVSVSYLDFAYWGNFLYLYTGTY